MTLSKAKIVNGKWTRKVPTSWRHGDSWRSDIFKSVLEDPRFEVAEFILADGPTVQIAAQDLAEVIIGETEHYNEQIWGPFDINPFLKKINNFSVNMIVIP